MAIFLELRVDSRPWPLLKLLSVEPDDITRAVAPFGAVHKDRPVRFISEDIERSCHILTGLGPANRLGFEGDVNKAYTCSIGCLALLLQATRVQFQDGPDAQLSQHLKVNYVTGAALEPFRQAVQPVHQLFVDKGDFSAEDIERARQAARGDGQ